MGAWLFTHKAITHRNAGTKAGTAISTVTSDPTAVILGFATDKILDRFKLDVEINADARRIKLRKWIEDDVRDRS